MINSADFSSRLKAVMEFYNLSPASFADAIGVQRSSISHLLSGRNKPSLDFVMKVLDRFKDVELYWLLNGKGNFPSKHTNESKKIADPTLDQKETTNFKETKKIDRIIIFYSDGTFENYIP